MKGERKPYRKSIHEDLYTPILKVWWNELLEQEFLDSKENFNIYGWDLMSKNQKFFIELEGRFEKNPAAGLKWLNDLKYPYKSVTVMERKIKEYMRDNHRRSFYQSINIPALIQHKVLQIAVCEIVDILKHYDWAVANNALELYTENGIKEYRFHVHLGDWTFFKPKAIIW